MTTLSFGSAKQPDSMLKITHSPYDHLGTIIGGIAGKRSSTAVRAELSRLCLEHGYVAHHETNAKRIMHPLTLAARDKAISNLQTHLLKKYPFINEAAAAAIAKISVEAYVEGWSDVNIPSKTIDSIPSYEMFINGTANNWIQMFTDISAETGIRINLNFYS